MEYEGPTTDQVPLTVSPIQRRLSASGLKVEVNSSAHQPYPQTGFNRSPVAWRCQGTRLMEALVEISGEYDTDNQLDSTPKPNASSVKEHDDDQVTTTVGVPRPDVP